MRKGPLARARPCAPTAPRARAAAAPAAPRVLAGSLLAWRAHSRCAASRARAPLEWRANGNSRIPPRPLPPLTSLTPSVPDLTLPYNSTVLRLRLLSSLTWLRLIELRRAAEAVVRAHTAVHACGTKDAVRDVNARLDAMLNATERVTFETVVSQATISPSTAVYTYIYICNSASGWIGG